MLQYRLNNENAEHRPTQNLLQNRRPVKCLEVGYVLKINTENSASIQQFKPADVHTWQTVSFN